MDNTIKKQLQNIEFEILMEIDRVCKLLGISYTLFAGTALGAVRHNGFIPWDDDIDIAMLMEDYNRFIQEAPKYLKDEYFLQTRDTDKNYPLVFAKVRNSNTTFVEEDLKDLDINHGVYIDVFPLNKIPKDKKAQFIRKIALNFLDILRICNNKIICNKGSMSRKVIKYFFHYISKVYGMDNILKQEQKILTYYNSKEAYEVDLYPDEPNYMKGKNVTLPQNIFSNLIEIEFENKKFPIISEFDIFLKAYYGDYMKLPPIEERVSKHNAYKIDLENSYKL